MKQELARNRENLKAIAWTIASKGYIDLHWKRKTKEDSILSMYISPVVGVANLSKEILDKFIEIVKVGHIYPQRRSKTIWLWEVNKQLDVRELLEDILPYIPTKLQKEQALIVKKFCELRKDGKEQNPYTWYIKRLVRKLAELETQERGGNK